MYQWLDWNPHLVSIRNVITQPTISTSNTTVISFTSHHHHFPKYYLVGQWLLGASGLVIGMVLIGGITQLTHSGLSMT